MRRNETIGQMIVRLRNQKRLSQEELADYSGVSTKHLSNLENDKVIPNNETILKLTKVLEVLPSTFTDKIGIILDERYKNGDFPDDYDKLGL